MIVRHPKRETYTKIDNTPLRDSRLSFKAVGLLCFLLSQPDVWNTNYRHLATVHAEGESAVRSALQELERCGYLTRRRVTLGGGRFDWECDVFENPVDNPGEKL